MVAGHARTVADAVRDRWRAFGQPSGGPIPVTLYLSRSTASAPRRLLHVGVASMPPAKMRVAGVNGTIAVGAHGITWTPSRAARLLGAQTLTIAWANVQAARLAPTFERGVPSRVLTVETADGGFEMEVGDRYQAALSAALSRYRES